MTLTPVRLGLVPLTLLAGYGAYECLHAIGQALLQNGSPSGILAKPAWGVAHYLPALLFLALLPSQFRRDFRARHPQVHRRMGRALVALGVLLAVSGIAFPYLLPQRPSPSASS